MRSLIETASPSNLNVPFEGKLIILTAWNVLVSKS